MSQLSPAQVSYVHEQAAAKATLSQIQNGLREHHDVHLTYMAARLLMIDLQVTLDEDKVVPPEPEPVRPEKSAPAVDGPDTAAEGGFPAGYEDEDDAYPAGEDDDFAGMPPGGPSSLEIYVDAITRPGSLVSGKVTFSDGKQGLWYVDSAGRLGIVPPEPGYQPSPADVPEFQRRLALEMRRLGYA